MTEAMGIVDRSTVLRFLTVAEVATILRVSKMTVYRLIHAGTLASVRVGRSFRVPQDAVDAYLKATFTSVGLPGH